MGTIDSVELQLFKEPTWGTGGTPTVRLMGVTEAQFTPSAPSQVFPQLRGSIGPGALGARVSTGGGANVKGVGTYEDINYWLENLLGIVVPSGAGPYVRAGVAPLLVSALNPRLMNMVKGDADGVYSLTGGLIDELTITCEQKVNDSQLTYEAKVMGKVVSTGTLASLSDRAVTAIMASDFAVYVDAVGGTPGATVVSSTVYGFQLKLKSNRVLKPYLGNLAAGGYDQRAFVAGQNTLRLSAELNATSKGYLDSIIGSSPWQKIVRLKATQGANIFQFDMGVQSPDAPPIVDDRDGVKVLNITGMALEASGLGNWLKYSDTSSVAVLA
jgi:hypothetical protein